MAGIKAAGMEGTGEAVTPEVVYKIVGEVGLQVLLARKLNPEKFPHELCSFASWIDIISVEPVLLRKIIAPNRQNFTGFLQLRAD